jgi:hypothetical protein
VYPAFAVLCLMTLVVPCAGQSPLIISEFMAANKTTLKDGHGDWPDWIELYNASDATVLLDQWTLTDDQDTPFVSTVRSSRPALSTHPG